jgi:Zn-finger nucleic acid-binding protein
MSDRSGIEIDYCPQCRGVWLDRGELDKIIERSAVTPVPQASAQPQTGYPANDGWARGRNDQAAYGQTQGGYSDGRKRKKENWLSELFD